MKKPKSSTVQIKLGHLTARVGVFGGLVTISMPSQLSLLAMDACQLGIAITDASRAAGAMPPPRTASEANDAIENPIAKRNIPAKRTTAAKGKRTR